MNISVIFAFFAYFAILLCIGVTFHKKQTSSEDFILGNRSLNFWLVALSAHASDMSAWLFMAFPMTIFTLGLSHSWIALGLIIGMFLNWHFIAPKLRVETEKYQAYTLSSYFEKRFHDKTGMIGLLSAVMILIFTVHYLSGGLMAMGFLFESLFGIDYTIGLVIAMVVMVLYTMAGGYNTVAWVDLFQGTFLLFVIVLVPLIAFTHLPEGVQQIVQIAHQKKLSLAILPEMSIDSFVTIFSLALGWGLGYFGMPHIITKFMGINDPKELYKSKWIGISWQVIVLFAAVGVGVVAVGFFPDGLENSELVFVSMVKILFHPLIAGFILCAILAANLSTMDSQILVCASVISEDFYKRFFKAQPNSKTVLNISRLGVVAVGFTALVLALNKNPSIMDTVLYSWSGLGSAFGPLVLMSLYYKHANRYGAIAGIISGGAIVLLWLYLNPLITQYKILPMIPGFFGSAFTIYLTSRLTSNSVKKVQAAL